MPPKEKIPAAVRNAVWSKYIGSSYTGLCFCCNYEPVTKTNYECGHIISEKHGGKIHLLNLRPICSACNKSIGSKNMEKFMEQYGFVKSKNWHGVDLCCGPLNNQNNLEELVQQGEIKKTVDNEIKKTVNSEIKTTANNEIKTTVNNEIKTAVDNEIKTTADDEIKTAVDNEIKTAVDDEIKRTINNEIKKIVDNEIKKTVDNEIKTTINNEIKTAVNNENNLLDSSLLEKTIINTSGKEFNLSENEINNIIDVFFGNKKYSNNTDNKKRNTKKNDRIDINTASTKELQKIDGIGEKTAKQIIAQRKNSKFKSFVDLEKRVDGVGSARLKTLKNHKLSKRKS
jgi:competence ComEA-like helix-hairpin-helix protein